MTKKVIMLQIGDTIEFYGSSISLYSKHSRDELGISKGGLNNYFHLTPMENGIQTYQNKKCKIVRGEIFSLPSTRGAKKKSE